jgi:AcrR family transcriptional regulator
MKKKYHFGQRGESLADAVVREATAQIEKYGESAFSVRKVAEELDVSATAPIQHFRSKDDLLLAVAQDGFRVLGEAVAAAMASSKTARTAILNSAAAYIDFAKQRPRLYQLMFSPRFGQTAEAEEAGGWRTMDADASAWPANFPYKSALADAVALSSARSDYWSRSSRDRSSYVEAHRAFVAPLYNMFREYVVEIFGNRNVDDRTLGLTLLLHGLGAQLAAGWIRRPAEESSRELIERFISPLLP